MPELQNVELRQKYGAFETNSLADTGITHNDTVNITVDWTDPKLAQIIRIRLLTDAAPWVPYDVSYVLGRLHDGRQVRVRVPFYQLGRRSYLGQMYEMASRDGINLNRLCGGHVRNVLSRLD